MESALAFIGIRERKWKHHLVHPKVHKRIDAYVNNRTLDSAFFAIPRNSFSTFQFAIFIVVRSIAISPREMYYYLSIVLKQ